MTSQDAFAKIRAALLGRIIDIGADFVDRMDSPSNAHLDTIRKRLRASLDPIQREQVLDYLLAWEVYRDLVQDRSISSSTPQPGGTPLEARERVFMAELRMNAELLECGRCKRRVSWDTLDWALVPLKQEAIPEQINFELVCDRCQTADEKVIVESQAHAAIDSAWPDLT